MTDRRLPNRLRAAVGRKAHSGQILVLSALFFTVMIGALGLAVDLGFAFSQKRSMQNAADAGALTGAQLVAKSTNPVQAEVEAIVRQNAMKGGTIGAITCYYVKDAGRSEVGCGGTVPADATGVEVKVTESHPTFFIQAVPGAPTTVTTSADARANVKTLGMPQDGPFIVCGIKTKVVATGNTTMDVMIPSGSSWIIDPAAVDRTFEIHGPTIATCREQGPSDFKGLGEGAANKSLSAPGWFTYKTGASAGLIENDVDGPNGCKANQVINNCVVFLPIAVKVSPDPDESEKKRWVVGFAPFYVTNPKSNEHHGKLLANYVVYGRGQSGALGWNRNYTGPITIRLTE